MEKNKGREKYKKIREVKNELRTVMEKDRRKLQSKGERKSVNMLYLLEAISKVG